jgi:hypothetical protein
MAAELSGYDLRYLTTTLMIIGEFARSHISRLMPDLTWGGGLE